MIDTAVTVGPLYSEEEQFDRDDPDRNFESIDFDMDLAIDWADTKIAAANVGQLSGWHCETEFFDLEYFAATERSAACSFDYAAAPIDYVIAADNMLHSHFSEVTFSFVAFHFEYIVHSFALDKDWLASEFAIKE